MGRRSPFTPAEKADKADRNGHEADLERRLAEAERTVGRLALENELLDKRRGG